MTADMSVARSIDLVKWVMSLTDEQRAGLLYYLCGWKPDIIGTLYEERRDES